MQASRGFVFEREFNPHGGKNKSCRCRFMPGIEGETAIEGYDPDECYDKYSILRAVREGIKADESQTDRLIEYLGVDNPLDIEVDALLDRWAMCVDACGTDDFNYVFDEISARSKDWALNGKIKDVGFSSEGVRKRVLSKSNIHEYRTACRLNDIGFECNFIVDSEVYRDEFGIKRRIGLADFSNGIEIKTAMTSKRAKTAVENYFESSDGKDGVLRIVIDVSEAKFITFDEVLDEVMSQIGMHEADLVSVMDGKKFVNVYKKNAPKPSGMAGAFANR